MGKYMRKAKGETSEVSVMEVQSSLGVRTRAKTLALQRLEAAAAEDDGGSYLELRSRRLEKPSASLAGGKRKRKQKGGNVRGKKKKVNLGDEEVEKEEQILQENAENEMKNENDAANGDGGGEKVEEEGGEGCFGENVLDFEGLERATRESTPCNLIIDPDNIRTPGSSTKPSRAGEASGRVRNSVQRLMPTTQEMNEFFAGAEEQQRKQFIEKYNFDPVNDKPLPGRFEWVKVEP